MLAIKQVKAGTDIKVVNGILEEDGCIVITHVLDDLKLQKLKNELDPHLGNTPDCAGEFYGYKTKRLSGLVAKSSVCREMVLEPNILEIMDEFLLRNCSDYQLNLTQAIQIGPGEPQQIMHPDDPMFPFQLPGNEKMINCMWAVDDFSLENGATHVVPGSHKWERKGLLPERVPLPEEITQGVMPAGSVLIYFASLLHSGGANRTEKSRTGIVMSYCLGWLRQSENHYLSIPIETAKTYPERLQKLLGYFVHKPNLGQVHGRDPIEVLQKKGGSNSKFEEFLQDEVYEVIGNYKKSLVSKA
jgi:ectoine hydroxylase-related dioxygenase (phytanoyl-CoA dioxygenase family)